MHAPPVPEGSYPNRAAAWDYLRHILDLIFSMFGAPADIVRNRLISPFIRADLNFWLRPAERLARLLLLAQAAEIPALKRRSFSLRRRHYFPRPDISSPDSTKWRVSFRVLQENRNAGGGGRGWASPCLLSRPLGMRLEALARVVLDPARYALRLARRLDRRPRPRAVRALLRPVRTERAPLMRMVDMARPLLGAVRFRFSSA
ncbi:MAG: hypothetical protein JNJ73_10460 [Hyphomonadaceae bacterium]|nr:hypothetical protein [Hyphomonadaceae bacterium]